MKWICGTGLLNSELNVYICSNIDKWVKFFILKQAIRSTNIKKKL